MDRMTRLYNQAQEHQGHVVIAFLETVPEVGSTYDHHIDGVSAPFQVIGEATREDFLDQTRRFNPEDLLLASVLASEAKAFLKVKAE